MYELKREFTPGRSAEIGELLQNGFLSLKDKYALIGDVRGRGLMQGVELVVDRETKEPAPKHTNTLMETAKRVNLLIGKGGLYGNALRIAPPLSTKQEHVGEALKKLDYAFAQVMEMSF